MLRFIKLLYYRLFRSRSYWHMRNFKFGFKIQKLRTSLNKKKVLNYSKNNKDQGPSPLGESYSLQAILNNKSILIKPYKNLVKNSSRVSLLASGPSINALVQEDFDRINSGDVLYLNGGLFLKNKVKSQTCFHLVTDPRFIRHNHDRLVYDEESAIFSAIVLQELINKSIKLPNNVFFQKLFYEPFKERKINILKIKKIHSDSIILDAKNDQIAFSLDSSRGIFDGKTVLYSGLQIIESMGYSEVDIYGADFSEDHKRFYQERNKAATELQNNFEKKILPSIRLYQKSTKATVSYYCPLGDLIK